ncbi:hypothetical protein HNY73_000610 [Argiope bruennichi]|uniref:Uncharacterized protein n=1 Tax=Argiope bruennichi TaxID=94029 RepID=A0A8T0G2D7_ARGBR|nr:hypothetical protein HNY73_000610 [Argiope bruennichi]
MRRTERAVSFGDTPRVQHAPEGDTGVVLCNVKADPKPVMNIDSRERFGEYICRASNPLGEKEVVIELKEGNPPPAPTLEVSSDKDTVKLDIKIVEDEDVDNDLRVTGFKVQYILALGSWNSAKTHEFKIGDVYELKNMSYNTQYIFRGAPHNAGRLWLFSPMK